MTLSGHESAVWAVAILPEVSVCLSLLKVFFTDMLGQVGIMVTAGADKSIKLWKAGRCTHTLTGALHSHLTESKSLRLLTGHTDCVRALAVVDSTQFLSASNDAHVRRWSSSGECLGTYSGHTNYIYSLSLLGPGGDSWVTGGEDRSVRIWKGGEVVQTLYLPVISVWGVAALTNGDIAAACNDGCVRVFTKDAGRVAPDEVLAAYEEELAKLAVAAEQELGGIKLSDLPGPESLFEPGVRDGQQKMVRTGEKVNFFRQNRKSLSNFRYPCLNSSPFRLPFTAGTWQSSAGIRLETWLELRVAARPPVARSFTRARSMTLSSTSR